MTQSNRLLRSALVVLGAGVGAAVTVRRARWVPVRVEGDSMEPTLPAGSLVAIAPLRDDPRFGAVVVVRRPDGAEHVKRVVATPGERFTVGADEVTLGFDRYAVAGDDRSRSTDSRHYGPVDRSDITGVARVCYWPPSAWRVFNR
ncbi:MAG: S26 family signal peptidase [Actinomycetota bacterium]